MASGHEQSSDVNRASSNRPLPHPPTPPRPLPRPLPRLAPIENVEHKNRRFRVPAASAVRVPSWEDKPLVPIRTSPEARNLTPSSSGETLRTVSSWEDETSSEDRTLRPSSFRSVSSWENVETLVPIQTSPEGRTLTPLSSQETLRSGSSWEDAETLVPIQKSPEGRTLTPSSSQETLRVSSWEDAKTLVPIQTSLEARTLTPSSSPVEKLIPCPPAEPINSRRRRREVTPYRPAIQKHSQTATKGNVTSSGSKESKRREKCHGDSDSEAPIVSTSLSSMSLSSTLESSSTESLHSVTRVRESGPAKSAFTPYRRSAPITQSWADIGYDRRCWWPTMPTSVPVTVLRPRHKNGRRLSKTASNEVEYYSFQGSVRFAASNSNVAVKPVSGSDESASEGTPQALMRESTNGTENKARESTNGTKHRARESTNGTKHLARESTNGTENQARESTNGTENSIITPEEFSPTDKRQHQVETESTIKPVHITDAPAVTSGNDHQVRFRTPKEYGKKSSARTRRREQRVCTPASRPVEIGDDIRSDTGKEDKIKRRDNSGTSHPRKGRDLPITSRQNILSTNLKSNKGKVKDNQQAQQEQIASPSKKKHTTKVGFDTKVRRREKDTTSKNKDKNKREKKAKKKNKLRVNLSLQTPLYRGFHIRCSMTPGRETYKRIQETNEAAGGYLRLGPHLLPSAYGMTKRWLRSIFRRNIWDPLVHAMQEVREHVVGPARDALHHGYYYSSTLLGYDGNYQDFINNVIKKSDDSEMPLTPSSSLPAKDNLLYLTPSEKESLEQELAGITVGRPTLGETTDDEEPSKPQGLTRAEYDQYLSANAIRLSSEISDIHYRLLREAPDERKQGIKEEAAKRALNQTCCTERSFKRLTEMRKTKGFLDAENAEYSQVETHVEQPAVKPWRISKVEQPAIKPRRRSKVEPPVVKPRKKRSTKKPKNAGEAFDQLFPDLSRPGSDGIPSWYPDNIRDKVIAKRAAETATNEGKEDGLIRANTGSPRKDGSSGLMKVVQDVGENLKKTKTKCPVQWSELTQSDLPCPSLVDWSEWPNIKDSIELAALTVEQKKRRLLRKQEKIRKSTRFHTVTQMHGLDARRHTDADNEVRPRIVSYEGIQERKIQRWLHENTLGKDAIQGCGGCRLQGYEMTLGESRPRRVLYPGLRENVADDYDAKRVATDLDLLQLVKERYGLPCPDGPYVR